ncbi:restriction endonuclease subunit S [Deinococcota bacterium DY0809b]
MAGEWVEFHIGDIAEIVGGGTPSTRDPQNFGGDVSWLTPKDLSGAHPRYVSRGARNLSRKGLHSSSANLLPKDTVLLTTRAPIGYVAIAANPIATNQGFRSLIVKPQFDHEFVYYWLKANKAKLERHASGSTFKELSGTALKNITIRLPASKIEQRAIAHILSTLDDKIELNRRMNETLEAMAQALFKSWFVDFDPVVINAIKAGNPIPEKFAERAAHYRALLENPSPNGRGAGVRGKEKSKKEKLPPHLLSFARQLRKNQTNAEALLWGLLRGRRFLGVKFRRQHPVPPYILDFYSHETKLAIEVDGSQHNLPEQRRRDEKRTAYLAEKGIRVLRFWSDQVLRETEAVLERIYEAVAEALGTAPSPSSPLPAGEGGERSSRRVTGWVDGADLHLPPEDILRLFPDRFVDSDLGPIPEGWEVATLGDVAESPRRTVNPNEIPTDTPYIGLEHMPRRSIALFKWESAEKATSNKSIFRKGEFLFGKLRPYFHKVGVAPTDGVCSTDIVVVRPKRKEWAAYTLSCISSISFVEYTNAASTGTKMPRTSWKVMSAFKTCLATQEVAAVFQELVEPMIEKIISTIHESRTLAALRDTLLPKLISGEIRVPAPVFEKLAAQAGVQDGERVIEEGGICYDT